VFAGSYAELLRDRNSPTGAFLRTREHRHAPPAPPPVEKDEWIEIAGARAHNLKSVDARFPAGRFTVVTGVSGSGKSTLIVDVLYANALRARGQAVDYVGPCAGVAGLDRFAEVVLVDQSPPARSSRSNPATYLKAMDELR